MSKILIIFLFFISYDAFSESRLLYKHWERDIYLKCVDEKLWVYTFVGLGMETTSNRKPFYDISTETKRSIDQKKCTTGI